MCLVKMCLIFLFYFDCELRRKKNVFLVKKTDMEWRANMVFFVKDTENEGDHCKKTPKMNGTSGDFCYRNRKKKIGVLHLSRTRFILS